MCRILRVWEAQILTNLSAPNGPGGSAREEPYACGGEGLGRLWEVESIVFYVSGELWEVQSIVFYVCGRHSEVHFDVFYVRGRLWEAHLVVLFTLRAGPPT